jgi:hypothetical protein
MDKTLLNIHKLWKYVGGLYPVACLKLNGKENLKPAT